MAQSRSRVYRLLVVLAMVGAATYSTGVTVAPAGADVSAVKGSAYSYQANISLFNGPATVRGFGQVQCTTDNPPTPAGCVQSNLLAANPLSVSDSPSVTLPTTGGNLTDADPDGAAGRYGPATIFGGKWPDAAPAAPPSGPLSVDCTGSTGATGSVTCNTAVTLYNPPPAAAPGGVGPGPIVADEVRSTCTASESGKTGSATFVNGVLETKYDAATQLPTVTEPIPASPAVGLTRTGTLDHIGDSYRVVFNEQITNADGSLTVNAVHMTLLGPTAVGDLIIGSVTCGVTAVASTTSTTQGGTSTTGAGVTSTTQAGATTTTQAGATTTTQAGATTTSTAGNTTTTAAGGGGSVSGGACGYFSSVGLFGGPQMLRGCGQASGAPATGASPSVTLPAAGSATPITGADADGATAEYGPAKIFSGRYPSADENAVAPPSGPISVSTQGVPGGTVTSSAEVGTPRGVGPGPVIADAAKSTCSASGSGVSGTTTITNGTVETKYDVSTQLASATENVPVNPPVGFTLTGTLDHIGDTFRVVYNEQITEGGAITVNAIHMFLLGPTAVGELVVGQSRCGFTATGGTGTGGGGTGTVTGGGVARTGTNALRLIAFAMLLVAAGANVRHWAPQFEWFETTPGGGRRRQFPRRIAKPRRPPLRPWD
jgi:hypothetical protein